MARSYPFSSVFSKKAQKKRKGNSKTKKSVGKRFFKWMGWGLLGLFLLSIFITLVFRWVNPPITPLMLIRKVNDNALIEKRWVDIKDISPYFIASSVASEDNFFLAHHGFDFGAIEKAIDERKKRKRQRGASTISQQTAKNVFLWPSQSWIRKGFECYFTVLIELFWSKERIMEIYLNVIEMGNGIYGCEAASQMYFKKNAKTISRQQAALITACYPNPRKWNPAKPTPYIQKRASHIVHLTTLIGKTSFDEETIRKAQERYKKHNEKKQHP
jgi:monofunctional biosynthetic peptidoglycan transglycosylase